MRSKSILTNNPFRSCDLPSWAKNETLPFPVCREKQNNNKKQPSTMSSQQRVTKGESGGSRRLFLWASSSTSLPSTSHQPYLTAMEPGSVVQPFSGKMGNDFMTSVCPREIESRFLASETNWMGVLLTKIRSTLKSRCGKDPALCFQRVEAGMPVNTQAKMSHRQPELRSGVWERCWRGR